MLPLYYLLPSKFKKLLLLISSYTFYGFWDWRFVLLLATSTIVDFIIGSRLYIAKNKKTRKAPMFVLRNELFHLLDPVISIARNKAKQCPRRISLITIF